MAEEALSVDQIKKKRNVYLVLSTLVLLFLGLIYAFSAFNVPMTEDFALDSNPGNTFFIMMITFCCGATLGSVLQKRIGIKGNLIVCGILFAVGFCGTGILGAATGSTMVLYIFYGVIGGLGVGMGYNTIIATTNVWFPDKVGFSSGVLMMGFGLSALIFGNLALLIRPFVGGMSIVLIAIGVLVAVLAIVLSFNLKAPPKNIIELMAPEKMVQGGEERGENDNLFKTPIFYIYYIWGTIVIAVGLATIGSAASDASSLGLDAAFAPLLVGFVSTANGLSRIIIGMIYDRTNIKTTMFIDAVIAVAAVALIVVAFTTGNVALYIPGALLCGFAYGGVPVIASAFARQRYGAKKYPFNLSVVNFSIALGAVVNLIIGFAVGADGRLAIFTVILVLSVIAAIDVFVFSRQWNKDLGLKKK